MMLGCARNAGADIELISYDKLRHCCWERAYETTDVVEWLVSHKTSDRA